MEALFCIVFTFLSQRVVLMFRPLLPTKAKKKPQIENELLYVKECNCERRWKHGDEKSFDDAPGGDEENDD